MLDFLSFRSAVEGHLSLDLREWGAEALLHEDLGFDSLTMAELSVLFGDAKIELPDELLTELRTLGDLHHYFTVLGALTAGDAAVAPTGTDR